MKVCIIKQYYDPLGPYESFKFEDITLNRIIDIHLSKFNGLSTFLLFEADHYILDKYNFKRYECEVIRNNNMGGKDIWLDLYKNNTKGEIPEENIDYGNYDVVWCRDPILKNIQLYKSKYPNTLFVYEEVEHNRGHCSRTSQYYDIIMKHNQINLSQNIVSLPQTISFPYPKCPEKIRSFFDITKEYLLYIDYRDVRKEMEIKGYSYSSQNVLDAYARLKETVEIGLICNLENSLNGCCFGYKSDVKQYLSKLAKSKYFISTMGRVGQSLVDAIELNCICFGTTVSPNHKLVCHPFCLYNGYQPPSSVMKKIEMIEKDKKLEEDILAYQKKKLDECYVNYQINILKKTIELKRKTV